MRSHFQNLINLAVIVVIAFFFCFLDPEGGYKTHSIYLPQSLVKVSSVKAKDVKVITELPPHFMLRGYINTSKHWGEKTDAGAKLNQSEALKLAKEIAAKHGANAILLRQAGFQGHNNPLDSWSSYWLAVRVNP